MSEFRLAFRSLLRAPVFTAVAVLTLALGIGANAAVFSVVDGILLKPLPFAEPDALVMVWEHNIPRDRRTNVVSPGNFIHWRESQQSFTEMAAFFRTIGATPLRGRTFTPDEDATPRTRMLISHGLWERRFGGDESILGRTATSTSGCPSPCRHRRARRVGARSAWSPA